MVLSSNLCFVGKPNEFIGNLTCHFLISQFHCHSIGIQYNRNNLCIIKLYISSKSKAKQIAIAYLNISGFYPSEYFNYSIMNNSLQICCDTQNSLGMHLYSSALALFSCKTVHTSLTACFVTQQHMTVATMLKHV